MKRSKLEDGMKKCLFVIVALLIMAICGNVHAAMISYTGSYGPGGITNTFINVNQFNPTLGTLNSAMFTLEGTLSGTYFFQNTDGPNRYAWWGQTGDVQISNGSMNFHGTVSSGYDPDFIKANMNKVGPFAAYGNPGDTLTGPTVNMNASPANFTFTTPSDLANFIGTGTVPFHFVATQSDLRIWTGGNSVNRIDTVVSGTVTAQYDYTSVPIPGAVWLLGSGLVGLVGLRRKVFA